MNPRPARLVIGLVFPLAILALGLLPIALQWGRLPATMATHFGLGGAPDGSMSRGANLAFTAVALGVCALTLVVIGMWPRAAHSGVATGGTTAIAAMMGVIVAGASASIVALNAGHDDWQTVAGPQWWVLALVLGGGLLVAGIAARVTAAFATDADAPPPTLPLDMPASTRITWNEHLAGTGMLGLSASFAIVGVASVLVGLDRWIGLTLLFVAAVTWHVSIISVRADRRGLEIRYGPFGWPRQHIPLDHVASASVIDVRPMKWGGWGYRGSLKLFRQASVVLRAGPGLRLDLNDGKVFVVTIDEPEIGSAVLNREVHAANTITD